MTFFSRRTSHFENKSLIITGASSGIGQALALELAEQRAKLVLAARNRDRLKEVAAKCRQIGREAIEVPTDVRRPDDCQGLIAKAIHEFGTIDGLVNNAGISMWAKFDQMGDLDIFERMIQVNYLGAVYCTYYALPYLKSSGGQIVAISSLAGKTGVPTRSGYSASKHAMVGFFESIRIELAMSGISVTLVYLGFVRTEIRKHAIGEHGEALGESPIQETKAMSPKKCAKIIARGMRREKREVIMTLRGKLGRFLKLLTPGLVDRIASRAIQSGK